MIWVDGGSGLYERILSIHKHYTDMDVYSSSDIGVYSLFVGLNLVSELVERFEGGFATVGSEVESLKEVVLIIDRACHCE